MYGGKKFDGEPLTEQLKEQPSAKPTTAEADRRGTDRHLFTATAEIIELSSGARFSTRTTDLGPGGCFVDTLTPFPVGSQVRVTVFRGKSQFETRGSVVYSQTGLGMGIAFDELAPSQRQALESWLAELTADRASLPKSKRPNEKPPEGPTDRAVITRLVQLLVSKGLLTEAEARSIFHYPII